MSLSTLPFCTVCPKSSIPNGSLADVLGCPAGLGVALNGLKPNISSEFCERRPVSLAGFGGGATTKYIECKKMPTIIYACKFNILT